MEETKNNVISEEVAKAEVKKWLDAKKIGKTKRDSHTYQIETLVSAICDGVLVLNDKNQWVQTLSFPLEDLALNKLTFKSRMTANENISASARAEGNSLLVMSCFISELTGEPSELIRKLDSVDYGISAAIGIFFY